MTARQSVGRLKVLVVVLLTTVCCVVVGVVVWQTTSPDDSQQGSGQQGQQIQQTTLSIGSLQIDPHDFSIFVKKGNEYVLKGRIGMQEGSTFKHCTSNMPGKNICSVWPNSDLNINVLTENSTECFTVDWKATGCVAQVLEDCYEVGDGHWYGGYEDWHQPWPFEQTSRNLSAFITNDSYQKGIGGVQERYFFSTKGVGIYVEDHVPLHLSFNAMGDGKICFVAKYERYPFLNRKKNMPLLKYHICKGENVKTIHEYMSGRFFNRPTNIPDERLFTYPIWSTWAQYHKDINQSIVLDFADKILFHNFSHSQIEIDDDWTPAYGDMDFNTDKFPDAKQMVKSLNDLGFRVTVWLHPFFNMDSQAFQEAGGKGYLMRQYDGILPELCSWWDGKTAGLLDVSNEDAIQWYLNKTEFLRREYNVSSFKYDAGEVAWLPNMYSSHGDLDNPNVYSLKWAELAYRSDSDIRHQEVRVGHRSQHLPIFVRMLDKDTNWDYTNGLKTLIPTALTFGILGYPFILPDMIGGNAYYNKPTKEIYIRWLQATVFMPSLQFSIVPWQFDEETINITKDFLRLHEEYSGTMIRLARECITTGAPIVRPLWWIAPEDTIAHVIDSEFLVGDTVLVAPVLDEGARMRDIYLPIGRWRHAILNDMSEGPKWLRNYAAELNQLPYFILE